MAPCVACGAGVWRAGAAPSSMCGGWLCVVESMCHDLWAVCLVNCVPKERLCVLCVSVFGVTVLVSDTCRGWLDNLLPTALFRKPCCFTPRGKDNRLQAVERAANALRYRDRAVAGFG